MLIVVLGILLIVFVVAATLVVRQDAIPQPEPPSPTAHLEDRKAAIYENLRDLQVEFRMGKLSDSDYQQTKKDLQRELAVVLAEIERISAGETAEDSAQGSDQAAEASGPA